MRRLLIHFALPLALLVTAVLVASAAACLVQDRGCCSCTGNDCEDRDAETKDSGSRTCHCVCALASVEPMTTDGMPSSPLCGRAVYFDHPMPGYELARAVDRPPRLNSA